MERRGFTLVELLVVVAVIGVLIGVLLPALSGARRAAISTDCLHRMRQLALAQQMYAADHEGQLVDYGLPHGGSPQELEKSWVGALAAYLSPSEAPRNISEDPDALPSPSIIKSPADRSVHWSLIDGGEGVPVDGTTDRFRKTSYGLNEHVTPRPPIDPVSGRSLGVDKLHRIDRPTETIQFVIMAYEGEFAGADHVHTTGWHSTRRPEASPAFAAQMSEISAHGSGGPSWDARSNYAFLDGHAATHRFRDVYTDHTDNRFDPTLR